MAKAKKLPSGNWRVQASKTINDQRIRRSFTADSQAQAEKMAKAWMERCEDYLFTSSMTINKAIDEYIALKSNILSPATIRGYRSIQNNTLKSIADTPLERLSTNKIQLLINDLSKNKSYKTVKNVYGLITVVMRQFAPDVVIGKISFPQKVKPDNNALSKNEIALLINSIADNEFEIPILLALWRGLRRSEIFALEWSDIDFDTNTISITKALVPGENGKFVLKSPKTPDSRRKVSLPGYIAAKFKNLERNSDRVFNYPPDRLTHAFPKICSEAGIKRYKIHDLRRSMATVGLSLNIADKIIMSIGGWNNPQTMKNVYQIVLQDDAVAAENTINNYFESLIKTNDTEV